MMSKYKVVGAAVLSLLAQAGASAAPIISPFADELPAASYSSNRTHSSTTVQSVFNGGYWNAGAHGTYWIQADMATTQTLSQVRFAVDVSPANVTWQKVYLSDSPIGGNYAALTPVAERSGFTTKFQQFTLDFAPTAGRYLEIVSNGGASWTALGDGYARSNWVDPITNAPPTGPVPEPGTWALMLAGLAGVGFIARRRRADPT